MDNHANRMTPDDSSGERVRHRRLAIGLGLALVLALFGLTPRLAVEYHLWSLRRMSVPALQRYEASHPRDLDAAYYLGMDYARSGKLREAGKRLLSVFQRDPGRIRILNDYAVVLIAQQRYVEALAALSTLVKVDPDFAPAWANLGRLHILNQMPFTAAGELKRATSLDNGSLSAFRDLGTAYQQSMNYRSALAAYQKALAIDPHDAAAGVGAAQIYQALSKPEDAGRIIEEVAKRNPRNADALATLGDVRLKRATTRSEIEKAIPPLQQAIALSPDNVPVLFNLGVALRRLGRNQEAAAVLRQALKVSPGYPAALYQLSQALLASGHRVEGQRLGEQFRLASAHAKLLSGLQGRLNQNPQDLDAGLRLAELYLSERQYGKATMECRQLLAKDPGNRNIKRLLVRVALASEYSFAVADDARARPSPSS